MPTITKLLVGHNSQETAYVVNDYPYGFRLRCQIRYWLETNKRGTRFCSQTTNPKRGDVWNKPKCSTYSDSGAMYLDENGHVQWDSVSLGYSEIEQLSSYLDTYGDAATNRAEVKRFLRLKQLFAEEKATRNNPEYGTPLYKEAYIAAIKRGREEEKEANAQKLSDQLWQDSVKQTHNPELASHEQE